MTPSNNPWLKLSPLAIVYFAVNFIKSTASSLVYLIPALVIGHNQLSGQAFWLMPAAATLLVVIAVSALLKFYYYRYRLSDSRIQIRSGVFQKNNIDLPFERIQNVRFEQPLFYRPTDHVCLLLDTAGTHKLEAKIIALPKSQAESLKHRILTHKVQASPTTPSEHPDSSQEIPLNRRSVRDLVLHGLASNRIWIILGALAPFFEPLAKRAVESLGTLGVDVDALMQSSQYAMWQYVLVFLSLAFIVMALIALLSVAGSIITFFDFRLTRHDDRYIRRNGLFTRHEVVMKLSRLQMITYQQNWLDRLVKRVNLKFEQLNARYNHQTAAQSNGHIMVPSVTYAEANTLAHDAWPDNQLSTVHYQPVSKRLMVRNTLMSLWLIVPFCLALLYFKQYELAAIAMGSIAPIVALIALRWKRWGYAVDEHCLYIRKGLIGVNYRCFPLYKVQQTAYSQSWFMRRFNVCKIKLVLACGGQTVPFIPSQHGQRIIDACLYRVEAFKEPWM